jgi:hypothetical protein
VEFACTSGRTVVTHRLSCNNYTMKNNRKVITSEVDIHSFKSFRDCFKYFMYVKDHLGDTRVYGRIILKQALKMFKLQRSMSVAEDKGHYGFLSLF